MDTIFGDARVLPNFISTDRGENCLFVPLLYLVLALSFICEKSVDI